MNPNRNRITAAAVIVWTANGKALAWPIVPDVDADSLQGEIETSTEAVEVGPFDDPPASYRQHKPGVSRIRVELSGRLGQSSRNLAAAIDRDDIQEPGEVSRG